MLLWTRKTLLSKSGQAHAMLAACASLPGGYHVRQEITDCDDKTLS
jgi:hypothetical protein